MKKQIRITKISQWEKHKRVKMNKETNPNKKKILLKWLKTRLPLKRNLVKRL